MPTHIRGPCPRQEAIERVYYTHQSGATKPFEEAVPREVLEKKVRTYLKQSVALEDTWKTSVTAEMSQRELYAALDDNQLLILGGSTSCHQLPRG